MTKVKILKARYKN